jgi:hypothetical protein
MNSMPRTRDARSLGADIKARWRLDSLRYQYGLKFQKQLKSLEFENLAEKLSLSINEDAKQHISGAFLC